MKLHTLVDTNAGLGIKIKQAILDYAYVPYGDLGDSHRVSLTYKFPCAEKVVKIPPTAAKVEPEPVVVEKIIILEDTHFTLTEDTLFEFDSVTLTEAGERVVRENTQILKDNPKAKIRIAGYASASGTEEYNQKLSERRAVAVQNILIQQGIDSKRLTTIGYGDTIPAMFEPIPEDIDSKEARANMRVIFEIIVQ